MKRLVSGNGRPPLNEEARLPARAIRWRGGLHFLVVLLLAACDEGITEPPMEFPEPPPVAESHSVVLAWNELARNLVAVHGTSPPEAARAYALLSIAQYDAIALLRDEGAGGGSPGDPRLEAAAVTAASSRVLAYLYPVEASVLGVETSASRVAAPGALAAGETAANAVLERARTDAAATASDWDGVIPTGPDAWFSSAEPPLPPLLPGWAKVRPWLMQSGDELRPPPPPAFGSPDFLDALAEVRRYSDDRTEAQQRIAEYWADGPGTSTPPGHWNRIAAGLIAQHRLDAHDAARVLAYMNMALMDAGISCWDAKYAYWLLRPTQADPEIRLAVELPNFPAYTSGHSAFSGAASEVLAHFFPAEAGKLRDMADEAAMSRVYGGIHYRFDSDVGLEQGRAIARLAIDRIGAEGGA